MPKKFKNTKVGQFLSKIAPDVLDAVDDYFPPAAVLTKLISDRDDIPTEQKLEFERLNREYELKEYQALVEDRKSARDLYGRDNRLQKTWAISFLLGYMLLTFALILMAYLWAVRGVSIDSWLVSLISAVWGAMSMKVSTINDFLYGGSQEGQDNTREIIDKMNKK